MNYKNILSNVFATGVSVLAPLLIIPTLTSQLGMEGYGFYVILMAKVALIQVISELGLGMYLAKEVSVNRNDENHIRHLISSFLLIKLVIFSISSVLLVILSEGNGNIDTLFISIVFFAMLDMSVFLRGFEDYKAIAKIQLFSKFIILSLVFLSDFTSSGLEKILIINLVMYLSSLVCQIYILKSKLGDFKVRVSLFLTLDIIKKSLPFYFSKLFVNIYQQSSTYIVSKFLQAEHVAIYSIAVQLYKLGQIAIGSIAQVLYTSTVRTKSIKFVKKITIVSIMVYAILLPIVFIYGDQLLTIVLDFDTNLLFLLSKYLYFSLLFVIVSSYWGYPVMTSINRENYAHVGIFFSSVGYFLTFGVFYILGTIDLMSFVIFILAADFIGMSYRLLCVWRFIVLGKEHRI